MDEAIVARIKTQRELKGLTQAEAAEKLGMSRTAYTNIELGKRDDISLTEAKRISQTLGISIHELMGMDEKTTYSRYKNLILEVIARGGSSLDGKITKTKLAKMAYLADFVWFYLKGVPITGATYYNYQRGPVADIFFRTLDDLYESGAITIEISGNAQMIKLSSVDAMQTSGVTDEEQKSLIQAIGDKWRDIHTSTIVDFTHEQAPWSKSLPGSVIPYESIRDEPKDHLY